MVGTHACGRGWRSNPLAGMAAGIAGPGCHGRVFSNQ